MNYFTQEGDFDPIGSDINKMDPEFMDRLNKIRHNAGFPFRLTSAYRSVEHELEMGRSGDSAHTLGLAVDIHLTGEQALWVVENARNYGFYGVGVNQTGPYDKRFIHLDMVESSQKQPRPHIWTY